MPSRKQTLVGSWLLVLFLIDDLEAAPAYDIGLPLRQTTSWPIIVTPLADSVSTSYEFTVGYVEAGGAIHV